MSEFSIFSPHDPATTRGGSDEDNHDWGLDDGGTVPDSGVSEAGSQGSEDTAVSEVSTVSVSDEIRRFQKEINTVAVENSKFFKWKQQRTPSKLSSENLIKDVDESVNVEGYTNRQSQNQIQHSSGDSSKRVSYSEKEVTVLGIPEEIPSHLFVRNDNVQIQYNNYSMERSRQIQPSSHVAPSHLPNGDITEDYTVDNYDDNDDQADDEDDEVPALPSVKLLTNKFQSINVENKIPAKSVSGHDSIKIIL